MLIHGCPLNGVGGAADVASVAGMGGALEYRRGAGGRHGRQLRLIDSAVSGFRAAEPLTRRIANAIAAVVARCAVTVGVAHVLPVPVTDHVHGSLRGADRRVLFPSPA